MSRSFTSVVSSKPLRFLITGCIDAWDPVTRELRMITISFGGGAKRR
jgi:hypothetical protein